MVWLIPIVALITLLILWSYALLSVKQALRFRYLGKHTVWMSLTFLVLEGILTLTLVVLIISGLIQSF